MWSRLLVWNAATQWLLLLIFWRQTAEGFLLPPQQQGRGGTVVQLLPRTPSLFGIGLSRTNKKIETKSKVFLFGRKEDEERTTVTENDSPKPHKKTVKERVQSLRNWLSKDEEDTVKKSKENEPKTEMSSDSSSDSDSSTSSDRSSESSSTIAATDSSRAEEKETTVSSENGVSDDVKAMAARLRAEAEKARLEAARMDAELTLKKISRLENELAHALAHRNTTTAVDEKKRLERIEELQRQMKALQSKIDGEDITATSSSSSRNKEPNGTSTSNSRIFPSSASFSSSSVFKGQQMFEGELSTLTEPYSETKFQETLKYIQDSPDFLLKTLAVQVDYDFETAASINRTELAIRFDQMNRLDFSFHRRPKPFFTKEQIERRAAEFKDESWTTEMLPAPCRENAAGNLTKLALLALEYEYYMEDTEEVLMNQLAKVVKDEEWLRPMIEAIGNYSAVDAMIENIYPKCTRKEGAPIPTEAQVQQFMTAVLPKVPFTANSKPDKVLGGYLIRGKPKTNIKGDEVIDAIDKGLARAGLDDKMTVLYANDFAALVQNDFEELLQGGIDAFPDPFDADPILYIMGPDVCRESRPLQLSLVSGLGLATSWYLSIYPFLINPIIAKRVDEEIGLADAGMTPDLSWLTDLSVPLFASFMGILLAHELGHLIVAGSNKIKISSPTFVPSLITGVTSTVTTFKSLPKNYNAMLDFSVAGPLAGMLASIAALALGSQLTLISDPTLLPALPLDILRQSTLGGGIINAILGSGALNVPVGAIGSQAVAGMTIPLHPVAIAGYIGLIVNALSMLPIGTTDGGRVFQALFGKLAKLGVGQVALGALLVLGILGSDLFLFYFAFLIGFQSGNEVPARNEVDKVSMPRAVLATGTFILALLSLIPFQ